MDQKTKTGLMAVGIVAVLVMAVGLITGAGFLLSQWISAPTTLAATTPTKKQNTPKDPNPAYSDYVDPDAVRLGILPPPAPISLPDQSKIASSVLANHAWWEQKPTAAQVDRMVSAIVGLQLTVNKKGGAPCLIVNRAGGATSYSAFSVSSGVTTWVCLNGFAPNEVIMVFPGYRGAKALVRDEAASLLLLWLDRAEASMEKYRKTGRGNGVGDNLIESTEQLQHLNDIP